MTEMGGQYHRNIHFINKTVPSSTSRKQLSRGILSKLPTIENEYVKQVLPDNSYGFLYEMLDAIRYTSHAISDIEKNGSRAHGREELDEQRRHLAAILETYTKQRKWRGKWEIHYNLGISNELDKQPEKAIEYYKNALKIIEEDKNVEGHRCFQAYIDELKTRIRQLESKLGHE
jgi:tetratricopeptide (TPR) repeat protein